uniref:Transmembrane protein 159 n=1 Tax=Poecilia mexicana TaxID=48701 RepID=A0A3B3WCH7_9TELE
MQRHSSNSSLTQQLGERWLTLMNRLQEDPKVSPNTGQYLRRRPFLALALLLFSAMAALPVGLFLLFALITIVMSVVGFVFFEVGGMTLLSVLSGIALFSLVVSIIVTGVVYTSHVKKKKEEKKERSNASYFEQQ